MNFDHGCHSATAATELKPPKFYHGFHGFDPDKTKARGTYHGLPSEVFHPDWIGEIRGEIPAPLRWEIRG